MNATNRVLMVLLAAVLLLGAYLIVTDVEEAEAADYGIEDVGLWEGPRYDYLVVTLDIGYPTNLSFTVSHMEDGEKEIDYSGTFTQTGQKVQSLRDDFEQEEGVVYTIDVVTPFGHMLKDFSFPEAYIVQATYYVDGERADIEYVHIGDCLTEPEQPVSPGKTFVGWFTADGEKFEFETPMFTDVRLDAVFGEGREYTIKIDRGIQNGTVLVPSKSYAGVPVTINAVPDDGYECVSYYAYDAKKVPVEVSEAGIFIMPASNVTVGAVFEEIPDEYAVYVVDQNGMPLGSSMFDEGTLADFDVPAREGYVVTSVTAEPEIDDFVYDPESMTGYFTMPDSDVTVTVTYGPEYEGVTASVYYEGQFVTSVTKEAGEEASIDLSEYIPEGYVATVEGPAGMDYTFEDGILVFTMPEEDVYFDLILDVEKFTVAFYDGEDLIGEFGVEYGKTITSIPEAPVKEGYTFIAWVTEDGKEFDFTTEIYADLDLFAEYEVMKFTVAFYDGEDFIGEVKVDYGKTVTSAPEAPVKEGYTFKAWVTEDGEEFDLATEIYEDLFLYAYYEPNVYAITVDEKVVGGTIQVPEEGHFGIPVCIVAEADEGYVFKSYYAYAGESPLEVSEAGIFVMPASDVTVGAVFEEIPAGEHAVKVLYGAMLVKSGTATEGKEMSIDVSEYTAGKEVSVYGPDGLAFAFENDVLTFVMPDYDVEFSISDVMYTVTFYVGEEEYDSQAVVSGECAYEPEDPVLAGAVFKGWFLQGAAEPFDFDTQITQDLDLYALMEPFVEKFDVEFYVNGGVYRTITVDYGEKVEEIEAPEIPGKTFKGWFLQGAAEPFDFDTQITQDLDLYAKYEETPVTEEHTVNFIVGGEIYDTKTVKDGALVKEIYPPYYPGQQFEGWYVVGSDVKFDFKTPITQDYNLYAFYEDVGFTVTFYVDSVEYDKQTVEAGGYAVKPADPVKAGAVFMGWFEPGAIAPFDFETPITQNVALNALFDAFVEEFTVTFYVDDEVYNEQTVVYNGLAEKPEDPVLAGAVFMGWFLEGAIVPFDFETPITQDLDLHALFEPFVETFDVTFYVDDEVYDAQAVPMGGFAIEPEDPVLAGAEFVGWYTVEGELFDFETPITEDLVLVAEFEPFVQEFTVTFYVEDEVYDTQTLVYNDLAVEPGAPSVEGSEFLGWFLVGTIEPFDFETPITQDLDLHAVFAAHSETVTVSLNQIGTVIYITVFAEDEYSVVKSGVMELQYTYVVSKMSFGKERLVVMTSPVIKVDIAGGETIAAVEYDLGSEEYLSTISTVWATYTADGIDSEKSAPILFESADTDTPASGKDGNYSVSVGVVKMSTEVRVIIQTLDGDDVEDGQIAINYTYTEEKMSFGKIRVVTYTASMDAADVQGAPEYASMKLDLGTLDHYSQIKTVWAVYTPAGDDATKSSAIIYQPLTLLDEGKTGEDTI